MKILQRVILPEGFDKGFRGVFFSDLHVGGNGDFNYSDYFLAHKYCTELGFKPVEFFYLGDIFDVTGSPYKKLSQLRKKHITVSNHVESGNYLKGNHEGRVKLRESFTAFGFHACHGYQCEWLFTAWRKPLGRLVCILGGLLERLGFKDIDKTPDRCPSEMGKLKYQLYYQKKIRPWALRTLEKTGAQVLIMGHTHRPDIVKYPGGKVRINCGSFCTKNTNTFVVIRNGTAELIEVE